MLDLLLHTHSSCISLVYDDLHEESARLLPTLAMRRGVCLEERLSISSTSSGSMERVQGVVRRLLLTEARVVVLLVGDGPFLQLLQAFRNEMVRLREGKQEKQVIAGRFILLSLPSARWSTSRAFREAWPHFDQLLLSVDVQHPVQSVYLKKLTRAFPDFPFPQHWLRQFWSTAFKCHVDGEKTPGEQFSKCVSSLSRVLRECGSQQALNLSSIAPLVDVAPAALAVHVVAHALRKLVDNVCPGESPTRVRRIFQGR